MQHHYLDEDSDGNISVHAPNGNPLATFNGDRALDSALEWAAERGLEIRSNKSASELQDNQRLYFRRRPRFLRLNRYNPVPQPSNDPPNVKRVIVPNYAEQDYEMIFPDDTDIDEDIELVPLDPDEED